MSRAWWFWSVAVAAMALTWLSEGFQPRELVLLLLAGGVIAALERRDPPSWWPNEREDSERKPARFLGRK